MSCKSYRLRRGERANTHRHALKQGEKWGAKKILKQEERAEPGSGFGGFCGKYWKIITPATFLLPPCSPAASVTLCARRQSPAPRPEKDGRSVQRGRNEQLGSSSTLRVTVSGWRVGGVGGDCMRGGSGWGCGARPQCHRLPAGYTD